MRYGKPRKYKKTSRYGIYRQIIDNENKTYTETANQIKVAQSDKDLYHEVQQNEVNRLDIISNKYYGTPEYFWAICMANDIVDPFSIKRGDVLRIPNFTSLLQWQGALYGRL